MARQGIFTGSSPNDGTGDPLVVGAVKVNQNFSEIYTTFGDGNNLVSYVNSSGVSTYSSISGVATYSPTAGVSTYASIAGYSTSSGIATVAQGLTGTPNINAGIITATSFVGDGSSLTGIVVTGGAGSGVIIKDSGNLVGTAGTIDFGNNLTVSTISAGVVTVSGGRESYWTSNLTGIHTFSNVGIGTTIAGSKLTVEGDGRFSGVVTATSFIGDGSGLTGVIGSSSGIVIKDSGSTVGTAGTIDFGDNLSVSVISAGIVTVTASGGTSTQWVTTNAGIHTLSNVGVGTTNPTSALTVKGNTSLETLNVSGITTSSGFDGNLSGTASTVTTSNQNYLRLGSPFNIYSASSELFSVITDRNLNNKKILIDYSGKMYFGSKVGGSLDTGGFEDAAMIITPGNEGGPYSSIQLDGHISAGGTIGASALYVGSATTITSDGTIITNQLNISGDLKIQSTGDANIYGGNGGGGGSAGVNIRVLNDTQPVNGLRAVSFRDFGTTFYVNDETKLVIGYSGVGIPTTLNVTGTTNLNQITETVSDNFNTILSPSSGTLTVDTSAATVVLGNLNASVTTWAFTNVPTENGKATTITIIIDGDTSQTYGDACTVNGSAVSGGIKWSGGTSPTSTNNFDILSFTIVKDGDGTINVFGSGNTDFS